MKRSDVAAAIERAILRTGRYEDVRVRLYRDAFGLVHGASVTLKATDPADHYVTTSGACRTYSSDHEAISWRRLVGLYESIYTSGRPPEVTP